MLNVLIPMGGKGKRFSDAGFTFPKPLIDVPFIDGRSGTQPMIQMVVSNLAFKDARYIFLASEDHYDKYSFKHLLPLICKPNQCEIILERQPLQGAAYACLLAKHLIDNDDELILANSDQWLDFEPEHFLKFVRNNNADGSILTFYGTHPKWSFCAVNEDGIITEVAEKKPISTVANTGVYYWARGKDFISSVEEMIADDFKVNGEFYVAPSYNYLIKNGLKIINYPCPGFIGTGTPEDLQRFSQIMSERNK